MSDLIVHLSLEEFCETVDLSTAYVIEIVEHGIVEPHGQDPATWLFDQQALSIARRAARLQRDLELEWAGIALALQLLDDVDALTRENRLLKQRLQRFAASH